MILDVGQLLEPYDASRMIPLYGFGGIHNTMGKGEVDHCFPISGKPDEVKMQGIKELVAMYENKVPKIDAVSGPIIFGKILTEFHWYVSNLQ